MATQTKAQRAGVRVGEQCPLCGDMVGSRDHFYDRHTAKGKARRRRYEGTKGAELRTFRFQEREARKKAAERAQAAR